MLYIDGSLKGEVNADNANGKPVGGGGPLGMTRPMWLCGREDSDPGRQFRGRLMQLSLWDTPLDAPQAGAHPPCTFLLVAGGIIVLQNHSKL